MGLLRKNRWRDISHVPVYFSNNQNVQRWANLKPWARSVVQISILITGTQVLDPSSTYFPGLFSGIWVRGGASRIWTNVHVGCQWLYLLNHRAGPLSHSLWFLFQIQGFPTWLQWQELSQSKARALFWVCHMGAGAHGLEPSSLVSRGKSRKLDWKWNTQDMNYTPKGSSTHQATVQSTNIDLVQRNRADHENTDMPPASSIWYPVLVPKFVRWSTQ